MSACLGRLLLFFNGAPNIPNIDTDLLLQTKRSQMRAPRFAGGLRKHTHKHEEQEVCTGMEHLAAAAVFLVVGLEVVMRVFFGIPVATGSNQASRYQGTFCFLVFIPLQGPVAKSSGYNLHCSSLPALPIQSK